MEFVKEMDDQKENLNVAFLNAAIRLNLKLLSVVFGTVSGLSLFVATLISHLNGGGDLLGLLSVFFIGYSVSIPGAFIGFAWAFFVGGLFGSFLYFTYARSLGTKIADVINDNQESNIFFKPQILKLESHSIALAIGCSVSLLLIISTNFLVFRGTANESVHASLLSFYLPGYSVSLLGSLVGALGLFTITYLIFRVFCLAYNKISNYRNNETPRLVYYKPKTKEPERLEPAKHVCILGAGPAGLATGHELSSNGTQVTVLERNDYVSGLCRTVEVDGYRFDLGGHRWFTQNEELNTWFRRLMKNEIVMVNRVSRIYYGGKYFNYPLSISDVVTKAGPLTIFIAGITFFKSLIVYSVFDKPVINMKQAYTKQFGSKLYEMFFKIYTEKVWGKPCEELSSDWVSQRSKGLNIVTIVREAIIHSKNKVISLVDEFMYPKKGFARICERLAEDILEVDDNKILLNSTVTEVVYHGPRDFEVIYTKDGNNSSVRSDSVVSTIPLGVLAQIIRPEANQKVIDAAKSMEFRDLITVNVMFKKQQVSKDTWLYLQDEDLIFGRLHEPKNWSVDMVPDNDHTSLVLEVFCTAGDKLWSLSDDEVAQRCVDDLVDKLHFVTRDEVDGWAVIRTRQAYPVYDLQYGEKTKIVNDFVAQFEGLHIAGRGGSFRYNNSDHSIEMGLMLGRKILGYPVDHMAVNTESTYHEEKILSGPQRDHYKSKKVVVD
jgi:protoporphyrinogen oxidase